MTTKRNREPHGTGGRTRDKGQVKYYLAVCSLYQKEKLRLQWKAGKPTQPAKMKLMRPRARSF